MMKHVFACLDGSASTIAVCDYACWAAQRLNTPLTLFHVLDEQRYPAPTDLSGQLGFGSQEALLNELTALDEKRNRLALQHGQNMLDAIQRRAEENGLQEIRQQQRHGSLVQSLTDVEADIRLLVIGQKGIDSNDSVRMGSQLETVIRAVRQPILVTPKQFRSPRTVMLAFDGSDTSRKGVKMLAESPIFKGMPIRLVTVGNNDNDTTAAIEAAANHLREYRHDVDFDIISGAIEPALHQYQKQHNIDLLVMGAYGHSRMRHLVLGSTTRKMIQASDTPLLLLR